MNITYEELPALDASKVRCVVLMENGMRCPERASYKLQTSERENKENKPILLCKHHFEIEKILGQDMGDEYNVVPAANQKDKEQPEYKPPQTTK